MGERSSCAWRRLAACRDATELFYGPGNESAEDRQAREAAAKKLCRRCPVRRHCLDFAVSTAQVGGVWGGLSAAERAPLAGRAAAVPTGS